jgi:hypothetical protein
MPLREWIDTGFSLLSDHWTKVLSGIVVFYLGRVLGRRRAIADWSRREFMNRLMVSLNSLQSTQDGKPKLAIRTLLEKNLPEVLLNVYAVERVLAAAARTNERDPILPLEKDDRWLVLNSVLNEIAERFAVGTLARDLGVPVDAKPYVICLTNEVAGPVKTRKIRAMVVREDHLLNGAFEQGVSLEAESHVTRIDTLKSMRERYRTEPDLFLRIELSVPR